MRQWTSTSYIRQDKHCGSVLDSKQDSPHADNPSFGWEEGEYHNQ